MKTKLLLIIGFFVLSAFQTNAQIFDPNEIFDWHDTIENSTDTTSRIGHWSYLGKSMTPKDTIRFLIIYAGFTNDWNYNSQEWYDWPYYDEDSIIGTSFPRNTFQLFYTNQNQFSDTATDMTISNFFYHMSLCTDSSFKVMADIFPERINVPLTSAIASNGNAFSILSKMVFDTIQARYPTFDWGKYDNRKSKTLSTYYEEDDRYYNPDNEIDYVFISFRYFRPQKISDFPIDADSISDIWYAMDGAGGYASIRNYTFHNPVTGIDYNIRNGFTQIKGIKSTGGQRTTIIHEWAHTCFDSPHVGNANGVVGQYFYSTFGWNMCNNGLEVYYCANAWERWWLNWIDIKYDLEEESDNGIYVLRDFVTTGDAIRIKIPNVPNQHLWLEFHSGETVFDTQRNEFKNLQNGPTQPPPIGLVAFIENIGDDRSQTDIFNTGANGIKTIDMRGNYDYETDITNFETNVRWWGNRAYDFNVVEENCFGSQNTLSPIRMDFYTNRDDYYPNGIINLSVGTNDPSDNESFMFLKSEGEYVDGPLGYDIAFETGQELDICSNPALFNYQEFNSSTQKLTPIYLHGINVKLLYYTDSTAVVEVKFDDYNIDKNVRMTGDIILLENTPLFLNLN